MTIYVPYFRFKEAVSSVAFILAIALTLFANLLSFKGDVELFSFHPSLASMGWLFMSFAIHIFLNLPLVKKKLPYKQKKEIHWMLQVLAVLFIGAGFLVIILVKKSKNKLHFQTWHSFFGLVSVLSCIPSLFLGLASYYSSSISKIISLPRCKQLHWLFGVATYVLCSITLFFSIYSEWVKNNTSYVEQNCMLIIVLISSLVVIQRPVILHKFFI